PPELPFLKFSPVVCLKLFPREALQIISDFMANAPSPKSNFYALALGAAAKIEPKGGNVVPFRKAPFYSEISAEWSDASANATVLSWVQSFRLAMGPFFSLGYCNVLCQEIADYEQQYYGEHVERLRQIKAKYDPHSVFYFEQSIR